MLHLLIHSWIKYLPCTCASTSSWIRHQMHIMHTELISIESFWPALYSKYSIKQPTLHTELMVNLLTTSTLSMRMMHGKRNGPIAKETRKTLKLWGRTINVTCCITSILICNRAMNFSTVYSSSVYTKRCNHFLWTKQCVVFKKGNLNFVQEHRSKLRINATLSTRRSYSNDHVNGLINYVILILPIYSTWSLWE